MSVRMNFEVQFTLLRIQSRVELFGKHEYRDSVGPLEFLSSRRFDDNKPDRKAPRVKQLANTQRPSRSFDYTLMARI